MKKIVAVVAGGYSSEYEVSVRSAEFVYTSIDKKKYTPYLVTISPTEWIVRVGEEEVTAVDKTDFSFNHNGSTITFDYAYIIIHGTPGEDGLLQGYFDMLGIPYSNCGVLASALTFSKFSCNQYLKGFGVSVAESILLRQGQSIETSIVSDQIGYPCFIKCNVGGSSYGCSKVKSPDEVQAAITTAFAEGNEVIIEAFLGGTEVTCGVFKTAKGKTVLPITEVVSENEFFDYDAKYNGQVQEITPARIADDLRDRIQAITSHIYDILDCRGIVRADYIISPEGQVHFLEINTVPGMTATSFIPQQIRAAGLEVSNVLSEIIG